MTKPRISPLVLIVIAFFVSNASVAAGKRLIGFDDMYKMAWASSLTVSRTSPYAAFVVKRYDVDKNSGRSSIWIANIDTGKIRQLTNSSSSDYSPRWMPSGRLAFLSERSGSAQIWSIDVEGGEAVQITDLPVSIDNFVLAPDGKHAALQISVFPSCGDLECSAKKAKEKDESKVKARIYDNLFYRVYSRWLDETRGHVFWLSLDSKELKDLTPGNWQNPPLEIGGYDDLSISPDSKEVAFTANATSDPATNTNNDIFTVKVSGGKPKVITGENKGNDNEPVYSPDGRYIAYFRMVRPGYESDKNVLALYDRATGKMRELTRDLDASALQFFWSNDSKEIVFGALDRAERTAYRVDVASGSLTKVDMRHFNRYVQYSNDGKRLVFMRTSIKEPLELYTSSLFGSQTVRLSDLNTKLLSEIDMSDLEEFEFDGAAGDKVHGIMLRPPKFEKGKKYPMVTLIHGGPHWVFGDYFITSWNMQMLAAAGFVVTAINFHGSDGYGQKFSDSIVGDWGGKPYDDIMKGVDYLVEKFKFIDGKNVSVGGRSYGGYLIAWILGHTDRFRSLVCDSGAYDLASKYGAMDELWLPEWEIGGTPWDNPEVYAKFSPSTYAKSFRTPTLVIHGERDFRITYTQALQLFTALRRQGVESRLLIFPDESHNVSKPQNVRLWWETTIKWLADHAGIKYGSQR